MTSLRLTVSVFIALPGIPLAKFYLYINYLFNLCIDKTWQAEDREEQ